MAALKTQGTRTWSGQKISQSVLLCLYGMYLLYVICLVIRVPIQEIGLPTAWDHVSLERKKEAREERRGREGGRKKRREECVCMAPESETWAQENTVIIMISYLLYTPPLAALSCRYPISL